MTDVLALQAAEIATAVRGGTTPGHADVATALQVMTVIDAAVRSSASQRVVSLGQGSGVSRG